LLSGGGDFETLDEKFDLSTNDQSLHVLAEVVLDIDASPKEVGWEIVDPEGDVVVEQEGNTYRHRDEYSQIIDLDPGTYTFSIMEFDEAGGSFHSR
jgi:hypothetical protein